jgi:hypothetical protein
MTRLIAVSIAVLFAMGLLQAPAVVAQATKEKPTKAPAKTADDMKKEPIDINSASAAELESLKGIGAATAKKIIDHRPYTAKDELVTKKVISQATYDKVKNQIVARQGAGSSAPAAAAAPPPTAAKTGASATAPAAKSGESAKAAKATTEAKQPPAKGMVWVNTESKVFHREGDRWYGKTKQGKFMTEADALKEGYREAKN